MPNSEKMPEDAREPDVRMEDLDIAGLRKMMEDLDIDELIQALGHSNFFVSSIAAEALGKRGDARAVEPLIKALGDSVEGVREGAVYTLRNVRTEAFYVLGNVRANAAIAVGEIGDTRAVEPLIKALSDSDESVREGAAGALEKMGKLPS